MTLMRSLQKSPELPGWAARRVSPEEAFRNTQKAFAYGLLILRGALWPSR